MSFSAKAATHLGYYVYALVDPRDNQIFYVGKASANNRAFDHLKARKEEGEKQRRIAAIRDEDLEPEVQILRYGLKSEQACLDVEAPIIDTIGLENLTNKVRGHGIERGRQTAKEIERLHGSADVELSTYQGALMLFFINRTYSPTKTEQEIYDCTRQYWHRVAKKTRKPGADGKLRYPTALAVVDSVVVRAYSIAAWFPAGATFTSRGIFSPSDRWEFVGQLLTDHPLAGRRLKRKGKDILATQQGYRYVN
ncbi:hypothetical protein BKK80_34490 (plasmid) [Cupriavidus malaysiensis]|uniref:GIY-YIG domain-containing protein n=2 Tax=Cupriavidus malaysiensis TaxID=367825 RepID=A0ABN4TV15_9BURK|nr:hypothetical protein BKK80_34490 [Cupriavidus malaysiensis]